MATAERQLTAFVAPRERTGNRRNRPTQFERHENVRTSAIFGSHMPLDTEAHWNWRNPLNVIPILFLVLFVVGIAGTLLTLI